MSDRDPDEQRPWSDLSDSGLLWLINRAVLHPRGFALAVWYDDDGNATGWTLQGDGTEPWQFQLEGLENELFVKLEAFLDEHRPSEDPA